MATVGDKHYRARITKRVDLAPELWVIRVDPGAEFKFTPGQYATLGVEGEDKRSERPYSIASSPYEKEVEFFFELVPHGELTPKIHSLKTGDELLMRKASKGRFTLDTASGRKHHLLVCTVTGVAPYVSFVRTLYRDWKDGKFQGDYHLYLLNGASRSWEFGYCEELKKYAEEAPWLKYVPTVSRPWEDPDWRGERGRVDDLIRKYTHLWGLTPEHTTAYLCGHPNMVENGRGILLRAGWTQQAIQDEVYFQPGKEASAST